MSVDPLPKQLYSNGFVKLFLDLRKAMGSPTERVNVFHIVWSNSTQMRTRISQKFWESDIGTAIDFPSPT